MGIVYDIHSHLTEYSDGEIANILSKDKDLKIVIVGTDPESSMRAMEIERAFPDRAISCVGFHPWKIGREPLHAAERALRLAYREGLRCIGEVGLDRRFLGPESWGVQLRIFRDFARAAVELGAFVNVHAPDAWAKTLAELVELGVERAVFHWYTGPVELLSVIASRRYMISINPAMKVQEKHRLIAERAPLESIVFESDGPYEYRGLRLSPIMVRETIAEVASMRGIEAEVLEEISRRNSERLIGRSC